VQVVRIHANPNRTVLEQPNRRRIVQHLIVQPGDHFRSIARALELSIGTTRHHLSVLAKQGLVRSERIGSRCRYYALMGGPRLSMNETYRRYWRSRDLRMRVWSTLQRVHDARPSSVAAALGVSRQLAGYHLKRLALSGLVLADAGRYRPVNPRTGEVDLYRRPVVRPRILEDSFRLGSATRALTPVSRPDPAVEPSPLPSREIAPETVTVPAPPVLPNGPSRPTPTLHPPYAAGWASGLDVSAGPARR
jgi:DNA-binding transcriptional ArsR family regulator